MSNSYPNVQARKKLVIYIFLENSTKKNTKPPILQQQLTLIKFRLWKNVWPRLKSSWQHYGKSLTSYWRSSPKTNADEIFFLFDHCSCDCFPSRSTIFCSSPSGCQIRFSGIGDTW